MTTKHDHRCRSCDEITNPDNELCQECYIAEHEYLFDQRKEHGPLPGEKARPWESRHLEDNA